MSQTFDISLTPQKTASAIPRFVVALPTAVSSALAERGYDRTKLDITKDGLLLRPYKSEGERARGRTFPVALPDWGDDG